MKRRAFLAVFGVGLASASPVLAQMMKQSAMTGMSMPGMDMADGPGPGAAVLPEGRPFTELPRLANEIGRAHAFSGTLTAAPAEVEFMPGIATPVLAYNGHTPGPMIEVTEGDQVRVSFRNRIPGEPSTIHWHGIPVPADQDGNPMDPIASGDARDYVFTVPKGSAGSYWYHPHPHGLTAQQVYRGLAGAFVIKPEADPIPSSYGDTTLFMTDLRLAPDGTMPDTTDADVMNGRVGDHVLVNGLKNPVLKIAAGSRRRFRLYNATNARYLRLSFGGLPITVIGTDGGLLERPLAAVGDVLLAPAERLELVVAFDRPGRVGLTTLDYDRGWMGAGRPADAGMTLLTVDVAATTQVMAEALPATLRSIDALSAPVVMREVVFGESMTMGAAAMGMGFTINGRTFDMGRVDFTSKAGEVEVWTISNPTDMDHPFHIHGTQFHVLDTSAAGSTAPALHLAWKDTVNVPRGATVRIALRQDLPGKRMFHCHILEHEQQGMMAILDVLR